MNKILTLTTLFVVLSNFAFSETKNPFLLPMPKTKQAHVTKTISIFKNDHPSVSKQNKTSRNSRSNVISASRHALRSRGLDIGHTMNVLATAYYPAGGREGGPITATGHRVRKGVIAVDPRIIPLFTRVYVEGYGEAIALDTGGMIKGRHIDLAFNCRSEMNDWGSRRVRITFIE